MVTDPEREEVLLGALAEQLAALSTRLEIVVVGGAALLALGLTMRPTRDIDAVALMVGDRLVDPDPFPPALLEARRRVASDFALPDDWLNAAPRSLLDFGLPDGFVDRLVRREYGPALVIHFASRVDLVHLKLYAMVDQGPGKHELDLRALEPTRDELVAAARWTRTHDPSEGFHDELIRTIAHLGVPDVDLGA